MANKREDPASVCSRVSEILAPRGFEAHPFKVGWFNELVAETYKLPYSDETLAIIFISTPDTFEKAFVPYLSERRAERRRDPINECVVHHVDPVRQALPGQDIEIRYQDDEDDNGRPTILVQTAAHVAGACFYYQRRDVVPDHWDATKNIYGVCIHPKYGGWISLSGVIIFPKLTYPGLQKREPPDVVPDRATRIELLERYNFHWEDRSYCDIIPVEKRYSPDHIRYLNASSQEKKRIIEELRGGSGGSGSAGADGAGGGGTNGEGGAGGAGGGGDQPEGN